MCLACAYTDIIVTASLQLLGEFLDTQKVGDDDVGVDVGCIGYIFPSQGGQFWGVWQAHTPKKRLKSGIFHPERMVQRYFRYNEPSKNSAASGTPQIKFLGQCRGMLGQSRHVLLL